MTIDELKAIPFYFVGSLAMEHEHSLSYESEDEWLRGAEKKRYTFPEETV